MNRILSLALACALALSLLTSCGGGDASSPGSGSPGQAGSDASFSAPDQSQPDSSIPTSLTLNRTELTLSRAGSSFQLKAAITPPTPVSMVDFQFASSDESIVTVEDTGTVTAVAPGTAIITVTSDTWGVTAQCVVQCDWEEETEPPTQAPTEAPTEAPTQAPTEAPTEAPTQAPTETPSAPARVDLRAFYTATYDALFPLDADGNPTGPFADDIAASMPDVLDMNYPGLTEIELSQCMVFMPMMTGVPYEIALIEVADSADADAVKNILQARIDTQKSNQLNYPAIIENWELNSRIVTHGSYIMMAVCEACDGFVDAFNDLF